jgi:hypothetical protein
MVSSFKVPPEDDRFYARPTFFQVAVQKTDHPNNFVYEL